MVVLMVVLMVVAIFRLYWSPIEEELFIKKNQENTQI